MCLGNQTLLQEMFLTYCCNSILKLILMNNNLLYTYFYAFPGKTSLKQKIKLLDQYIGMNIVAVQVQVIIIKPITTIIVIITAFYENQ